MTSKRKKKSSPKSSKKGGGGKMVLLLIVICLIAVFHRQIYHFIKPFMRPSLGKKNVLAEKKKVLLYFSDREEAYLIGEKREILKKNEVNEEAKEMILELIKGPKGKLIPTVPPQAKILSVQLDDKGVAKVNFDRALSRNHPGGSTSEMMTVYSIVNSLTHNFPQVKEVQILIEGEAGGSIAGHLSLEQPIPPKPDLIRRQ
jgi:spore germination protein GerM